MSLAALAAILGALASSAAPMPAVEHIYAEGTGRRRQRAPRAKPTAAELPAKTLRRRERLKARAAGGCS